MSNLIFLAIFLLYFGIIALCFVVSVIKFKRETKISAYRKKRSSFKIVKDEDDKL
jgi:hypothetical protein